MEKTSSHKPKVGISSCILGNAVRYDGQHARTDWAAKVMSEHFEWLPVCPELGAGLGLPRETIRLVDDGASVRLKGTRSGDDHTESMNQFSRLFLRWFAEQKPHGFILKAKSPSCGFSRIKVHESKGERPKSSSGLFAAALMEAMPELPIEEDGRLNDPALRANFVERVHAYQEFQTRVHQQPTVANLMAFHSDHKLALMARDPEASKELGRLVASARPAQIKENLFEYSRAFSKIMQKLPSAGKHANVLEHLMGYVKGKLSHEEKQELLEYIRDFQKFLVPLSVPLTLLRHHLRKAAHPWVERQSYLRPYPGKLLIHQEISQARRS